MSQQAIEYAWRQLASRAGIVLENGAVTGLEGLHLPIFYGDSERVLLPEPGLIVSRCADSSWDSLLTAPENSLHWVSAKEAFPPGARPPFNNQIPVLLWGVEHSGQRKPFAEQRADGSVVFYADILAASFFMLARLEEIVIPARDKHERFPATISVAYRQGFLDIPVVDQYAIILREWLKTLLPGWIPQPRKFEIRLTHDIDHVRQFTGLGAFGRAAGRALLKEANLPKLFDQFIAFNTQTFAPRHDMFYRAIYDLAKASEEHNMKSRFYFMTAAPGPYQDGYSPASPLVQKCINDLCERGHEIGLHPGYSTLRNPQLLVIEKLKLEQVLGRAVMGGRQHYLRFQAPETWRNWESAGLHYDSSLGFAEQEGFRAGTCYPYYPFDLEKNREIRVQEVPLIVMDVTLFSYR
ncbi:MAG TPA: polysaccharide deacetylase family protein, partial [Anaerolineales bacterium]|nr:polysaccharide deacetylase family protein [Anaerolineales bacterium]